MTIEKMIELAGSDQAFVDGLKLLQTNTNNNVERINSLETQLTDVKSTRDSFKSGNALVKNLLGLEKINEDTLNEYLANNKKSSGDEKLLAEIDNYKNQMEKQGSDFGAEKDGLISQIRELKNGTLLSDAIAKAGIIDDGVARSDLANTIKGMMSYNDKNEVVFLNDDGATTKFNAGGQPYSINDAIVSELEKRPYLKGTDVKSGGGASGNDGSGASGTGKANLAGSKEERMNYIAEKYNK